jgi:DNA processing protein
MIKTPLATYLALNKINNFGTKHILRFEKTHTDITHILPLSNPELIQLGWNEKQIQQWRNLSWKTIEDELTWANQPRCHIIHWHDPLYPRLLKEIHCPPPILYIRGEIEALHRQTLAIVGTRHPTTYGKQNAEYFSQQLAELGFCIASGLAIGIDGIAHQHALPHPTSTIAVVATGLDQIYPERHKVLATKIIENGAIVSEFPFKTPPRPEHFPQRNRIISGLSRGVLVIEAALKSGSLITARYAMEQGREVFAIPGIIQNPNTQGCHALIRQGAVLVNSLENILEELGYNPEPELKKEITENNSKSKHKSTENHSNSDKILPLLEHFDYGVPTPIDILIARSGLSPEQITTELLTLELSGSISRAPNGYYRNLYSELKIN